MSPSPQIVGLIPARGGSKGLPRKNLAPLAGKPLIAWTIGAALRSAGLQRVIVSTEDEEIAEVARHYGAETPFQRPAEIARDESSSIEVVEHALHWLRESEGRMPDYLLLLQPTTPLRQTLDIDAAIALARQHDAVNVVSVCETGVHPYNTKRITEGGGLEDFLPLPVAFTRRQEMPPAYILNGGIYLNRPDSLLQTQDFSPPGALPYIMPPERSIDVDTPHDLALAEWMLRTLSR